MVPPIPPRRTRLYRVRRGTVVCVPPITTGPVTGTIAVTAADATSAISAFVGEQGTIAVTVADTTSVITANIGEQGTIAVTAGDATSVMTGTVTAPAGNTPAHGGLEHFVWPHPTPQRTAVQRPYQLLVPRRPYAGDLNVTTSGATATITAIFDISALEDEELLLDLI